MEKNKMRNKAIALIIGIVVLALAILALFLAYRGSDYATGGGVRMCTQEAKICPDGSAVGRTGPNCEFARCPGE